MGVIGGPVEPAALRGEPRALISRAALLHNAAVLSEAGGGVKLCGVVKADAYGHSAVVVADALTRLMRSGTEPRPSVDLLAVATVEEAALLGEPAVPVLILRPVSHTFAGRQRELLEYAVGRNFILSVNSGAGADDLERVATAAGKRAGVHLAMDTGLTREGIDRREFDAMVERVRRSPALKLHSVSTHFSDAEEPDNPLTPIQMEHFDDATRPLAEAGVKRHAANTAGVLLTGDGPRFDFVRCGIGLYGIDPSGAPRADRPLRPALRLVAPLTQIRTVRAGTSVGYGRTWAATRESRIGLVPVGYADGYPRLAGEPRKGPRPVCRVGPGGGGTGRGGFAPVVGRVSMDYVTLDLTDLPDVGPGDEVTLIDDDPLSPASVYALARHAATIPYEVLSRLGTRVPRVAVEPSDAELEVH